MAVLESHKVLRIQMKPGNVVPFKDRWASLRSQLTAAKNGEVEVVKKLAQASGSVKRRKVPPNLIRGGIPNEKECHLRQGEQCKPFYNL